MNDAVRKRIVLMSIALAVLLCGALHWRVLRHQQTTLDDLRCQSLAIESKLSKGDVRKDIEGLAAQLQAQEGVLPPLAQVTQVLETLSQDLTALGVSELAAITGPTQQVGTIQQIPLGVTFRGSFASVFEILRKTQDYPRLIRMERLVIRRDPASPLDALQVTLRFDAFAHYPQEQP